MPSLIVMRHAKAVERHEAEDDFERGLTETGHADADRAAEAMKTAGLSADLALVSPARRTLLTFQHVGPALGDPPVQSPMALYHASPGMLRRAIGEAFEGGAQHLVLVGHNPGVGALAHELAERAGDAKSLPRGWPTAAAVAFDLANASLDRPRLSFKFNPKG